MENQKIGREEVEKGISLLERRGFVERVGEGYSVTPKFWNTYTASMNVMTRDPENQGKSFFQFALEKRYDALIETILFEDLATKEEIYYMRTFINP